MSYKNFVPVAQLDRALASEAKGCRFESRRGRFAYHLIYHILREILDIQGGDC